MFCRFLELCCEGLENRNVYIKDKVYLELQIENGLADFMFPQAIILTNYGQTADFDNADKDPLCQALYDDFIGNPTDYLPDIYKNDFELITNTRKRIFDTVSETAFAVDFRDEKAVDDFKQKIISENDNETLDRYGVLHYSLSNAWERLRFVIIMTDMVNQIEFKKTDEYKLIKQSEENYLTVFDSYENSVKEYVENTTGKPFDQNDNFHGMKMEDYLSSEKTFRALKEPFSKVKNILDKYGYSTDITYEQIVCGEEFINLPFYGNYCSLIETIYQMVKNEYKEMTLQEKADVFTFIMATEDYNSIARKRYMIGEGYETEKWADENNIPKGVRNMGNPDYAQKVWESYDKFLKYRIENISPKYDYITALRGCIYAGLSVYDNRRVKDFARDGYTW